MTDSGFFARTLEYRWPVVRTADPPGVRPVVGYVAIIQQETESGAPLQHWVTFLDQNQLLIQSMAMEDVEVFADAAKVAEARLLRQPHPGRGDNPPLVGDII